MRIRMSVADASSGPPGQSSDCSSQRFMSGNDRPQTKVVSTSITVAWRDSRRGAWLSRTGRPSRLSGPFEHFGQVEGADAAAAAVEAAADVHQAAGVGGDHGVGARLLDERGLVLDHGAADA